MPDLADDLRDLGQHLDVSENAGLPGRVVAAIAAEPGRTTGWVRRRAVIAAITLTVATTGWIAAPALADWWQMLLGGVEIRRTPAPPPAPTLPPAGTGGGLDLGQISPSPESAASATGLPVRRLAGADPTQTWRGDVDGVAVISLVYPPDESRPTTASGVGVLLQQFSSPIGQPALMTKFAGADNRVEVVSVNGAPGVWIQGGHGIALRRGDEVLFVPDRLAANTLAWEENGVTFRLESALDKEAALKLARSLR